MSELLKLLKKYILSKDKGSFYILKLTNEISYPKETIDGFKELVNQSEIFYPGIDKWFDKKVMPGIHEGSRYAFLVFHKGRSIGEAIVKPGKDSKLCSLRLEPDYQKKSVGTLLFSEVAKTLKPYSDFVHFTAPESLVLEKGGFFNSLGFNFVGKANKIYRKGEDELVFRTEALNFKRCSNFFLNESNEYYDVNINIGHPIIMSIKPKYAFEIINNKKTVEIRRKFSKELRGTTVFLYASHPQRSVLGEAIISDIQEGNPLEIWSNFKDKIGCSYNEYVEYCKGLNSIKAIFFEEITPYSNPLPWSVFSTAFNAPLKPPQSYQFLKPSGFLSKSSLLRTIDDYQLSIFSYLK